MTGVRRPVEVRAADGGRTPGVLLAPDRGAPAFLLVTGWEETGAKYLPLARDLYAQGWTCLTFDLRGQGATAEQHDTVTRERNLQDVLAAYDLLASQPGVDAEAIAVSGVSYGGYLAALLTRRRPVRWLALRVPALYRDEDWADPKSALAQHGLDAYRHRRLGPGDNTALAAAADFAGDVLLVGSGADEVVPRPVIADYQAAFSGARALSFRMIEGADHGLSRPEWAEAHRRLLTCWARDALTGHRAAAASDPDGA